MLITDKTRAGRRKDHHLLPTSPEDLFRVCSVEDFTEFFLLKRLLKAMCLLFLRILKKKGLAWNSAFVSLSAFPFYILISALE